MRQRHMRIDWTQTLLGPEGQLGVEEATGAQRLSVRTILLAGRMAGLLGAVLIVVGAIATSPLMGSIGARMDEILAVSGLLVVQVIAFAIARNTGSKGILALAALCGLQVLLVAGLNTGPAMVLAIVGLVVAEQIAIAMLLQDRRRIAAGFCFAGLIAGATALVMTIVEPVAAALVAGIAIPSLAMLPLTFVSGRKLAPQVGKSSSLAALLDVALSRFPGPVLIVDGVGAVQQAEQQAMFTDHLRASAAPGGSLTETLLVVDRPVLLQALSRAIHDQLPSENLILRMREDADAGHFGPKLCSIWPVAGLPGRALVLIAEQPEDKTSPLENSATQLGDQALIQRAMHDAVSPFNAGLGYLELIADPRLAPRDLASTRHYAQEARSALIEAHRNTALMGRWLKLLTVPQPMQRERVDLARITNDAARIFTSAEGDAAAIEIEAGVASVHAEIPGEAARFAIGVLLRGALRLGKTIQISITSSGTDAVIRVCPVGKATMAHQGEDVFQMALEQAAQGLAPVRFIQNLGEHALVLRGAVVAPLKPLRSDDIQPLKSGRLAS
ncbi:MAG: hypothetical protein ACRDBL_11475 [Rhabdaerophilum sp.]